MVCSYEKRSEMFIRQIGEGTREGGEDRERREGEWKFSVLSPFVLILS